MSRLDEAMRSDDEVQDDRMMDEMDFEESSEACPGCGAEPGDGLTEGCTDENGCGFWRNEMARDAEREAGWPTFAEDYE